VLKDQQHYYLIFNEEKTPLDFNLELVLGDQCVYSMQPPAGLEPFPEGGAIHLDGTS